MKQHLRILSLLSFLLTITSFAGGFEKNVLWSGKHAGIAGAGASSVEGPDSLLFNPAGLVDARNFDITVNASPTWGRFKAPLYKAIAPALNEQADGKRTFSPVLGLNAAYKLNEDFAIGLGYFVAGGSNVNYGPQDVSKVYGYTSFQPEFRTLIAMTEASVGAAYRINPALSFGAAWRMSMVNVDYISASITSTSMLAVRFTDLKDTTYNGFRIGFKYAPEGGSFGFGVNARTKIKFKAEGDLSGDLTTAANKSLRTALLGSKGSMSSNFPLQVATGAHYNLSEKMRIYGEWVWTQYSINKNITASGTLRNTTTNAVIYEGNNNTLVTRWNDQHNFRIATECTEMPWAIRAGYVLTTAVVPPEYAKPTLSTPGLAHTVTLGTGKKFMDDALSFDTAFEYSWAHGSYAKDRGTGNLLGDYDSNVMALHLGLGYIF